jgi:hypothetical protein
LTYGDKYVEAVFTDLKPAANLDPSLFTKP